jgi:hypothetical protein
MPQTVDPHFFANTSFVFCIGKYLLNCSCRISGAGLFTFKQVYLWYWLILPYIVSRLFRMSPSTAYVRELWDIAVVEQSAPLPSEKSSQHYYAVIITRSQFNQNSPTL